jgi:hypothetical protein
VCVVCACGMRKGKVQLVGHGVSACRVTVAFIELSACSVTVACTELSASRLKPQRPYKYVRHSLSAVENDVA